MVVLPKGPVQAAPKASDPSKLTLLSVLGYAEKRIYRQMGVFAS